MCQLCLSIKFQSAIFVSFYGILWPMLDSVRLKMAAQPKNRLGRENMRTHSSDLHFITVEDRGPVRRRITPLWMASINLTVM